MNPNSTPLPAQILSAYPPDGDALYKWLRERMTIPMLDAIARADHGFHESFDAVMALYNFETQLEGNSWSIWDELIIFQDANFGGEIGSNLNDLDEFFVTRAYCAMALLRFPDLWGAQEEYDVSSLLALTLSCIVLGEEALMRMASYLVHTLQNMSPSHASYLFYGLSLAAVTIHLGRESAELASWYTRGSKAVLALHSQKLEWPRTFVDLAPTAKGRFTWREFTKTILKGLDKSSQWAKPLSKF